MVCTVCGQQFDQVPATAVRLFNVRGVTTYKFEDGAVHCFKLPRGDNHDALARGLHKRWHTKRKVKQADCKYCQQIPA